MVLDIDFEDLKPGDRAELSKTLSESDVYSFAGISMDFNPIHIDQVFASTTRFKKRVAHGMLSASLISAVIGTALPGRNTVYLEQQLKFKAPVYIGDTLTAVVTVENTFAVKRIVHLKTEVFNQEGKLVIDGKAIVMKPAPG